MTAQKITQGIFQAGQYLLTLLVVSFAVYGMIGLMPGDPVDLIAAGNPQATPADIARLREIYGVDQPLLRRYAHWLHAAVTGDFGYSRLYGLRVMDVILPRLYNTVLLTGTALAVTLALAVPLGVYAAAARGQRRDRIINVLCLSGISVPPFWCALVLIAVFAVALPVFPASADMSGGFKIRAMVLPVATLVFASLAAYTRHIRSSMIDALACDHIRTARAKGCSHHRTLWHHGFKSALPAVITLLMMDIGTILGGAVTIETIFAFPGMGKLMFDAVMGNDFNLALCGFLILAVCVLAANFVADIFYRIADPRQRATGDA